MRSVAIRIPVLLFAALALGCATSEDGVPVVDDDGETLVDVEYEDRLPPELLVLGNDYAAAPVPTFEETRDLLSAEGGALLDSLMATGMGAEEAALMVNLAAGHGSGQPHDPVRVQSNEIREAYHRAAETFETELQAAEAREGVTVDRGALVEAGVIVEWEELAL